MTPSFEKKLIEISVVLENNVASEIFIETVLASLRDILCVLLRSNVLCPVVLHRSANKAELPLCTQQCKRRTHAK